LGVSITLENESILGTLFQPFVGSAQRLKKFNCE
jgi:hypothetical protein